MGRSPCCAKEGLNRGAWTALEDKLLRDYITIHGEGRWRSLPLRAGLKRCGKSCRLRWLNYLRPDIKRGNISHDEEELIIRLHRLLGNRWSLIAGRLPGRTDNEIKNYWNTNLAKKLGGESATASSTHHHHHKQHSSKQSPNKEKKSVKAAAPTQQPWINSSTCVVWTKASKCSKVFLNPDAVQQQQPDFDIHDNNEVNMVRVGGEFGKDKEESNDDRMVLSFSPSRDHENSSDFGMDVDELCLSEFLNFADLYDQNQNNNDNDESSDGVKLQTNATTTSTTSFQSLARF